MGVYVAAIAYFGTFFDAYVRADINILAYFGGFSDGRQRTYTRFLGLVHLIKGHESGQTFIGVLYFDECGTDFLFRFEIFIHQNDGRPGSIYIMCIFRIRQKRKCARYAFFYFGKCMDGCIFISYDGSLDVFCNLFR